MHTLSKNQKNQGNIPEKQSARSAFWRNISLAYFNESLEIYLK